jgi:hypothetical protein
MKSSRISHIPSTDQLCTWPNLGLRDDTGQCRRISCGINTICLQLGLRGVQQKCTHNAYEISALYTELRLRDVPGKLVQRSRQTERIRRLIAGATRLDPAAGKVIRIPRSPRRLLLPSAQGLAGRLTTSPLSGTNSIVGTKPAMADATRALLGNGHDEPSSPSPAPMLSCNLGYRPGGSLLESRPGSFSESAEVSS